MIKPGLNSESTFFLFSNAIFIMFLLLFYKVLNAEWEQENVFLTIVKIIFSL